jgi:hypothetical protein
MKKIIISGGVIALAAAAHDHESTSFYVDNNHKAAVELKP